MGTFLTATVFIYDIQLLRRIKRVQLIIGPQKIDLHQDKEANNYSVTFEYKTLTVDFFVANLKLILESSNKINTIKGRMFLKNENNQSFHKNFNMTANSEALSIDFGTVIFKPIGEGGYGSGRNKTIIPDSGWSDGISKMEGDVECMPEPMRDDSGSESIDYDGYAFPEKINGRIIQIFYGTNRNKTGNLEANEFYGDELSEQDELSYGSCLISIPKDHEQGNIERPSKILWIWSLTEDEEKHIVLKKIEEKTETDFFDWLKVSLPQTENKSGLLFVHGYNNTFAEAAWRTGQIAYDTPFNGLTGFFSWPSAGEELDYLADEAKADASVPKFEQFIEDFIIKTGVEKLHIIAHSMGNLLVTKALSNLANRERFRPYIKTIQQIILAAPDLDQDVFNNNLLPTLKSIGDKRTLYASDKDQALKLSEVIRRDRPRLGQGGENIFVADGIDSVDASNVMSEGNHHSYIFETKELLMDMNILFEEGWGPNKRRLEKETKNGFFYWLFRK